MPDRHKVTLLTGGHKGAEAEFGRCAQRWAIPDITYSFEGHQMEFRGEVRMLSPEELAKGDVSMEIVSQHMGRTYTSLETIRRVIQSLYHIVVHSYQVFAVGWIQTDGTVMGGTGWGVELAKFFNRPVSVYDQDRNAWFTWQGGAWVGDTPAIGGRPFAGTGTRRLTLGAARAIQDLYERSFGPAPERRAGKRNSNHEPAAEAPAAPAKPQAGRGRAKTTAKASASERRGSAADRRTKAGGPATDRREAPPRKRKR